MAKLHSINIRNFRGFSEFYYQFAGANFIALIGRGDSGKTTILEAISFVLSPNWTIPLCDTDFHNCNISEPIEITATVYDLPKELIKESTQRSAAASVPMSAARRRLLLNTKMLRRSKL